MSARFRSSQYSEGNVTATGEEIPFVLKKYKRAGPGILDELMLRDEFDAAAAAAAEVVGKATDVAKDIADDVLAQDKPIEERPVTYLAISIFLLSAYVSFRRRATVKLGTVTIPDVLPKAEDAAN
jgi:hypothetical protein